MQFEICSVGARQRGRDTDTGTITGGSLRGKIVRLARRYIYASIFRIFFDISSFSASSFKTFSISLSLLVCGLRQAGPRLEFAGPRCSNFPFTSPFSQAYFSDWFSFKCVNNSHTYLYNRSLFFFDFFNGRSGRILLFFFRFEKIYEQNIYDLHWGGNNSAGVTLSYCILHMLFFPFSERICIYNSLWGLLGIYSTMGMERQNGILQRLAVRLVETREGKGGNMYTLFAAIYSYIHSYHPVRLTFLFVDAYLVIRTLWIHWKETASNKVDEGQQEHQNTTSLSEEEESTSMVLGCKGIAIQHCF